MTSSKVTDSEETDCKEIELKLQLRADDLARIKRQLDREPHLHAAAQTELLESQYFDTDDHRLHRYGATLRVRRRGEHHIQTVKCDDPQAGQLFDRGEWESEIDGESPDLRAARATGLKPLTAKKFEQALRPVFKTSVQRTTYRLGAHSWAVELALDKGQISGRGRHAPILEMELELRQGEPSHLFALADSLRGLARLRFGVKSKAARGYDLIERKPIGPVQAAKLRLRGQSTADQAFRAIARSCLYQLAANEPALQHDDAEAVHQMRIAIRRLRTAISLFSDIVSDGRVAQIKSELKWMAGQLAAARELDVFLRQVGSPPRVPPTAKVPLRSLHAEITRRRDDAVRHAKAIVDSRRFDDLLFETLRWIEAGPWSRSDGAAASRCQEPLARFAARELSRRCRKIAKRGKDPERLDARQRHKLRIQAKKARYATDFFAAVFAGGKAKKRNKRRKKKLVASLKRMQDALGELNDVMAHEQITARIAQARAPSSNGANPRRAYAAGLVLGEEEARIGKLLRAGAAAHSRFRGIKPFWK